mgnify:CR=1 FL=1
MELEQITIIILEKIKVMVCVIGIKKQKTLKGLKGLKYGKKEIGY